MPYARDFTNGFVVSDPRARVKQSDKRLVQIAPAPALTVFERSDDWMLRLVKVLARVSIGR